METAENISIVIPDMQSASDMRTVLAMQPVQAQAVQVANQTGAPVRRILDIVRLGLDILGALTLAFIVYAWLIRVGVLAFP